MRHSQNVLLHATLQVEYDQAFSLTYIAVDISHNIITVVARSKTKPHFSQQLMPHGVFRTTYITIVFIINQLNC